MKGKTIIALAFFVVIASTLPALSMERTAVITGSRVQMHEKPDGDSAAVGLLNRDTVVGVTGRTQRPAPVGSFIDFWYHVTYWGRAGWVFGQFLNPSSRGRGLGRIFVREELIEYCALSSENLTNIKEAGAYVALVDASALFLSDIKQMTGDPVLSAYSEELEVYRLFAACTLAVGYAGMGDVRDAKKIRAQLVEYDLGTPLPDKTTLNMKIDEIDVMIQGKERPPQ